MFINVCCFLNFKAKDRMCGCMTTVIVCLDEWTFFFQNFYDISVDHQVYKEIHKILALMRVCVVECTDMHAFSWTPGKLRIFAQNILHSESVLPYRLMYKTHSCFRRSPSFEGTNCLFSTYCRSIRYTPSSAFIVNFQNLSTWLKTTQIQNYYHNLQIIFWHVVPKGVM